METPAVDTFEHDIADEIRHKEASIEDIASASGEIGNNAEDTTDKKSQSVLISIVTILTLCGLVGAGYVGYLYVNEDTTPTQPQTTQTGQKKTADGVQISTISPTLSQALGNSFANAEKTSAGYIIEITSYPLVFSYMIKNEQEFGDELASAVGNKRVAKNSETATSTEKAPLEITTTSSSTTATSTEITGTSTIIKEEETLPTEYIFSDITLSNQNMRIANSLYGTVVYAFIGTQKLVISSSTDGILSLRNKALQK